LMNQSRVSIHAPARGATIRHCKGPNLLGFQSTPLREGRLKTALAMERILKFQSTPLREGRPWRRLQGLVRCRFNPRPCARGDRFHGYEQTHIAVSIHAPARGATPGASGFTALMSCFNPRPCARGD